MVNFNIDFSKWVVKMLEKYENSPIVRRLVHLILVVVALFPLSPVFVAIIEYLK